MTRMNIKVSGLDKVMKDFSLAGIKAQGNADKVTETYTRKMASEGASNAPVDSGDLRADLASSPQRLAPASWQFGGSLPYTRRQEYEHPSNKGFIRNSVYSNRNEYREALKREVSKFK